MRARSLAGQRTDRGGRAARGVGESPGIGLPSGYQQVLPAPFTAVLGGLGGRTQLAAAGPDRPQTLGEARPGPGLDLDVAKGRLRAGRLEVLEPRVRLSDQEQLHRFLVPGQAHACHLHSGWTEPRTWTGRHSRASKYLTAAVPIARVPV